MELNSNIDELISVILPIYNVVEYLSRCVESLCCQTYSNIEIILVDDGSTDGCSNLCDSLCKQDPRIKALHKKNGGTGSARNYGLDYALGKFVSFVDPDDYVDSDYIEYLYNLIVSNNADIAFCPVRHIGFPDGVTDKYMNDTNVYVGKEAAKFILCGTRGFSGTCCHTLFSFHLFCENRFLEGGYAEDLELIYRLALSAERFVVGHFPKYNYCYRSNNSSSVPIEKRYEMWKNIIDRINMFVKSKHPELLREVKVRESSNSIFMLKGICKSGNLDSPVTKALLKSVRTNTSHIIFYKECPLGTKCFSIISIFGMHLLRMAFLLRLFLKNKILK